MGRHRLQTLMHRFLVPDCAPGLQAVTLPEDEAKHALRVLRLSDGAAVEVGDGRGMLRAAVLKTDGRRAELLLGETLPERESPVRITLYQGLPKADKLDYIIQKCTELGVFAVAPVRFARCIARDSAGDPKRSARLARIAMEAVKQCGRASAPKIAEPRSLPDCLPAMARHALLLLPWEDAGQSAPRIAAIHADCPDARDIGVIVGPEGGIAPEEAAAIAQIGGRCVTLGPRILRTETAAVAVTACIQGAWGDL